MQRFLTWPKLALALTGLVALGTLVDSHSAGFGTEREAQLDAEQVRGDLARAPIIGEIDNGASEPRG
jgi:hypothetical protein